MEDSGHFRERIILVEDNPITAEVTTKLLQRLKYQVVGHAKSGTEAIREVLTKPVDLILMDIMLEGELDGIDTARYCYNLVHVPVVFVTGNMDEEIMLRSKIAEPFGFLLKPVTSTSLHYAIQIAINTYTCTRAKIPEPVDTLGSISELGYGMIIVDTKTRILYMNGYAETFLDIDDSFLQYREFTECFRPHEYQTGNTITLSDFSAMIQSIADTGEERYLYLSTPTNGHKKPFVAWARPIRSFSGDDLGTVLILQSMEG